MLISSVIKVNATGHIREALRFALFTIFSNCSIFRRSIWLLYILNIFVVESLAGFKVDKAVPGFFKFTWSHWSGLEIINKYFDCE
jgi:hypothetical protein